MGYMGLNGAAWASWAAWDAWAAWSHMSWMGLHGTASRCNSCTSKNLRCLQGQAAVPPPPLPAGPPYPPATNNRWCLYDGLGKPYLHIRVMPEKTLTRERSYAVAYTCCKNARSIVTTGGSRSASPARAVRTVRDVLRIRTYSTPETQSTHVLCNPGCSPAWLILGPLSCSPTSLMLGASAAARHGLR
eukprot:365711-Chlamydomonas_euryale.AAC.12